MDKSVRLKMVQNSGPRCSQRVHKLTTERLPVTSARLQSAEQVGHHQSRFSHQLRRILRRSQNPFSTTRCRRALLQIRVRFPPRLSFVLYSIASRRILPQKRGCPIRSARACEPSRTLAAPDSAPPLLQHGRSDRRSFASNVGAWTCPRIACAGLRVELMV